MPNVPSPQALVAHRRDRQEALSKEAFDGKAYDAGYAEYMKKTIY